MRVYKTKTFARFQRREGLTDAALCAAGAGLVVVCSVFVRLSVVRLYHPKTAIFDLMSMPPARVRRIWRPVAVLKTRCSWSAGRTRAQ